MSDSQGHPQNMLEVEAIAAFTVAMRLRVKRPDIRDGRAFATLRTVRIGGTIFIKRAAARGGRESWMSMDRTSRRHYCPLNYDNETTSIIASPKERHKYKLLTYLRACEALGYLTAEQATAYSDFLRRSVAAEERAEKLREVKRDAAEIGYDVVEKKKQPATSTRRMRRDN